LSPAGGHNAQALNDHFEDGDLAEGIGRVSGVLFDVCKLGDRGDRNPRRRASGVSLLGTSGVDQEQDTYKRRGKKIPAKIRRLCSDV
jgi:hypothetical protein